MTWMPDRGSAPRGRQHSDSSQRSAHRSEWAESRGHDRGYDRSYDNGYDSGYDGGFDGTDGHPRGAQDRLGIPRILGRRARWVGARLRRDT
ncbi:hypothetical protein [Kitasatospora purpeofusca]|uniref:hypothetical protein n=1 Tax=Kitasatospora purpeofusca TaxID=67352 RepID=UPI0022568DE3|nr:hypothetical protein [Kitasatospora purpeofusca]MCX4754254.1 hypothetical protein [Kitasatospora purpeofusca]WSR33689.1 hypothetical protein OG715_23555 [Kitasatospora purpeofusca]WSR41823.1 hypothetical protein OG196_23635 [Kitasatospora purpeofusca]